jgi:hypothetical protein
MDVMDAIPHSVKREAFGDFILKHLCDFQHFATFHTVNFSRTGKHTCDDLKRSDLNAFEVTWHMDSTCYKGDGTPRGSSKFFIQIPAIIAPQYCCCTNT